MIQLDHKCVDETEAAVRRLAVLARKEPLFDAAAHAQAPERPKVFLAALDQVRTALEEAQRAYRAGIELAALKVAERRARLLGLDAPDRAEVTGAQGARHPCAVCLPGLEARS
jgi:hypothetical protein